MWLDEAEFRVVIGGNTYINVPSVVAYKGERLFGLKREENGELGIYFEIHDAQGNKVGSVKRNEIYVADKSLYAIEGTADTYVLKERSSGNIICEIKKRMAAVPAELEVAVRLYTPDGFLFEATPTRTNIGGVQLQGNVFRNCAVGIGIGERGTTVG